MSSSKKPKLPLIGGPHNRTGFLLDYEGKPCAVVGDNGIEDHEYLGHYVYWLEKAWRISHVTRDWNEGGYYSVVNAHRAIAQTHYKQRVGRSKRQCREGRLAHSVLRPAKEPAII